MAVAKEAASAMAQATTNHRKFLICGNRGSAADAQHIAAELIGRYKTERRALPVIALTTASSLLTAWLNDYSYGPVLSRQVEGLGQTGDVLIGISTSGNSEKVLLAFEAA
jgi:D-sedoheptulose 7-phosphate isomerase